MVRENLDQQVIHIQPAVIVHTHQHSVLSGQTYEAFLLENHSAVIQATSHTDHTAVGMVVMEAILDSEVVHVHDLVDDLEVVRKTSANTLTFLAL